MSNDIPAHMLPELTVILVEGGRQYIRYGNVWKNISSYNDVLNANAQSDAVLGSYVIMSSPVDLRPNIKKTPKQRGIHITITETTVYERTFSVKDLEAITGKLLDDDFGGNTQEFAQYISEEGIGDGDFFDLMRDHGEVLGRVWDGMITEVDRT